MAGYMYFDVAMMDAVVSHLTIIELSLVYGSGKDLYSAFIATCVVGETQRYDLGPSKSNWSF